MNVNILRASLAVSVVTSFLGSMFRTQHWPYTALMLKVALVSTLLFILLAIVDIRLLSSRNEKLKAAWTVAIVAPSIILNMVLSELNLLLALIAGVAYLAFGRKKIRFS